jgi:hypothetical protein
MPSPTYIKLASYEAPSGGVASVNFASISSSYTDLVVRAMTRNTSSGGHTGATQFLLGSSIAPTSTVRAYGDSNSGKGSDTYAPDSGGVTNESTTTANFWAIEEWYVPGYRESTAKGLILQSSQTGTGTTQYLQLATNYWSSTAAITSITLQPNGGTWAEGSTFYLYGISNT